MKNKKAFTIVEVLAVVVLLGVLAGIALPIIQEYIDEARTEYNKQVENQLLISGKDYFSANRNLLPKLTYLEKIQMAENKNYVTAAELSTGNYLKKSLVDYDGNNCDDSYVVVVKNSTSNDELWYPCLICGEGSSKKPISENAYCALNINWNDKEKPNCKIIVAEDVVKGDKTNKVFNNEYAKFKFEALSDNSSGDNDKNYLSIFFQNHTTGNHIYKNVSNYTQSSIKNMILEKMTEEEGIYSISIIDKGNNKSDPCIKDITIDNTDPTCKIEGMPNDWTNEATLKNIRTDSAGSLHDTPYAWKGTSGVKTNYSADNTYKVTENYTYTSYIKDRAENESECTATVTKIDNEKPEPPTYVAKFADGSGTYNIGTWTNKKVLTTISATDRHSGIKNIQYQKSGTNTWTTFNFNPNGLNKTGDKWEGTEEWTVLAGRNDTYYFKACDNAGNCSNNSKNAYTIKYDTEAPTTPVIRTVYDIWGSKSFTPNNYSSNAGVDGTWTTTSNDPMLNFTNLSAFSGIAGAYVELETAPSSNLPIQIFYATSSGSYNETNSARATLTAGQKKILISFGNTSSTWTKLRFDIGASSGLTYKIKSLGVLANPNQWNNNNIILDLKTTENHSGVDYWQYTYSSAASTTGSNSATQWVTHSSSSSNEFLTPAYSAERDQATYLRVCDKVGNCSSKASTNIKIDKKTPTVSISAKNKTSGTAVSSGSWSSEGLNFTLTAGTTGLSGYTIKYCKDTANTCTPATVATSGSAITSYNTLEGTYYIRYQIIGGSGNSSSVGSYKAMVEFVTPTVTIAAKKKSSGTAVASGSWSTEGLNFTLTAETTGSSDYTIKYCKDTANTCTPGTTATSGTAITTYNTTEGTYYIRCQITSAAGKSSSIASYKAMVDTITPTVTIAAKKKTAGTTVTSGSWSKEGLNFTLTAGTTGSSGYTIKYCKDTANACAPGTTATSGTAITTYNTTEGTYYIRYQITSAAGKSSSIASYKAMVDTTAPAVKLTNSSEGSWTNKAVKVSATATETGSGIDHYEYDVGSGWVKDWTSTTTTTASKTWDKTKNRNYSMKVKAIDKAGNSSASKTANVKIDIEAPTLSKHCHYSGRKFRYYFSDTGGSGVDEYKWGYCYSACSGCDGSYECSSKSVADRLKDDGWHNASSYKETNYSIAATSDSGAIKVTTRWTIKDNAGNSATYGNYTDSWTYGKTYSPSASC